MGEERGLFLNLSKCKLFWPSGISQSVVDKFPPEIKICKEEGTELLGAPISTSMNFVRDFVLGKVEKVKDSHGKLLSLKDAQMSYLLLKYCLNVSKLSYVLRVVNPSFDISDILKSFDISMHKTMEDILLATPIDSLSWRQSVLPVRLGGLGLQSAELIHDVAYFSSILMSFENVNKIFR
mmetsp:Transcript_13982/g.18335  ORF Transcript_13982/g.18335 Transcript_13982/m.18335 type:complete len:180 (+) Transcript_13982:179-718(+)